ncbi:MAG: FUSC family protein [Rhodocyclaceae bacterium]|nr:FUSC family protein [Rhodocyclaceae bacterium]
MSALTDRLMSRPVWLRLAGRARRTGRDWLDSEGPRWTFVVKTLIAAFLALWIAFCLGFDSPRSAMMTVFIVALPSSGMALEKGVYRLLGTLVGCVAALGFVGMFPQQAMLLFISLAIWAGLCTAGSALMRNARSYGFVLAGYTACMIALPALSRPLDVFDLAVSRATEISLGILCSAFVNDVLFPRHQSEELVQKLRGLYLSFATLCSESMQHLLPEAELERRHLDFATDVAALESQRAASVFEAGDIRIRSRQLHAFSLAAMAALTTFHTLHQLMERLRRAGGSTIPQLMQPLFNEFNTAMLIGDGLARTAAEAEHTRLRFNALFRSMPGLIEATRRRHAPALDEAQMLDLETALELLQRLGAEFRSLVSIYASLPANLARIEADAAALPPAYSQTTPPGIVLAAGLRNGLALLILASAWYALNWPSAAGAVMIATIFCGLASSSPEPHRIIHSTTLGFTLATPFAFFCAFFMLNRVEGFDMLVLSMLPFLAAGAYLSTWPLYAGVGVGFNLMFAQMVAPENLMRFNAISFINDSMAQIIGLLIAGLMFALILPEHRQGSRRHIREALWHEASLACITVSPHLRHLFENRIRDLLNQLGMIRIFDEATRAIVNEAMVLLELGHAVISLRRATAAHADTPPEVRQGIEALARYFRQPQARTRQAAIAAAGAAMDRCQVVAATNLLADLHLIRTCLLDTTFDPDTRPKENDNAA